jgi:ribonuclease P protein component
VIGRLVGHRAFEQLRREGVRTGIGPVRLVSRLDTDQEPRIAFAIPRSVGSAVARNRIRRRLRAVLVEIVTDDPTALPGGDHLIRVTGRIDRWSPSELRTTMRALLRSTSPVS